MTLRCLACIIDAIPPNTVADEKTIQERLRNGPPAGPAITVYRGGATCQRHLAAFLAEEGAQSRHQAAARQRQLLADPDVQALMRGAVKQARDVKAQPPLRADTEAPGAPQPAPASLEEARAARLKALGDTKTETPDGPPPEM